MRLAITTLALVGLGMTTASAAGPRPAGLTSIACTPACHVQHIQARERSAEQRAKLDEWAEIERERLAKVRAERRRQAQLDRWAAIERERLAKVRAERRRQAQLDKWAAIERERLAKVRARRRQQAELDKWAAVERQRLAGFRCVSRMRRAAENNPIGFAVGRVTVDQTGRRALREIAAVAADCPNVTIRVEGHTDNVGPANANEVISRERATSVVDYLVRQGVSRSRLEAVGYGMTRPLASNDTANGRARNRRIEFAVAR